MKRIGLIGFGTVGSGVYERLNQSKEEIHQVLGEKVEVAAILVKDRQKKRTVHVDALVTTNWEQFLEAGPYDLVFEAIGGIEPALTYTKYWLEKGIPVITANKKLVAEKGEYLEKAAQVNSTYYGYEAAVAGGIPIINALKGTLATTAISRVSGILNGTTNYMLTEMIEKNRSFADVLIEAQQLGYAEADPTDDLEGYDAWYKIRILSRLCFGYWPQAEDFSKKGVSAMMDWHVEVGERIGFKIKLIAEAWLGDKNVAGRVSPAFLTQTEPLTSVRGVTNGISLEGNSINQLLFIGPGAGKEATANSMVEDLIFHERTKNFKKAEGRNASYGNETFTHSFVFLTHEQRDQALQWVKDHQISVLDTFSHHEGEVGSLNIQRSRLLNRIRFMEMFPRENARKRLIQRNSGRSDFSFL
ncbi:homoserine dehydrogenase [Halalkalibacter wakoensis JCM 9140]|uniref:Homoserine dehydrogenase n=1 Tax=Halalkalibacter wakoensis JCM 9140 TaxID=1236970 RepID=W4Q420_9BACI|nr:homoserine dehydrogenase [Halalkalibacter wakoensis]GAE26705.1 homoserine dehydrogenase [Halalkalibacter wakoensis JCM 9140]